MRFGISAKRLQIDKAQSTILLTVCICSAITIFSLISTKALLSQASYHHRELAAKKAALKQINNNISAANNLGVQYQVFNSSNPNVLGGKNSADPNSQPPNGTNSRIILDALPSKYDFPALVSSVSGILTNDGIANPSISGTDQSSTINGSATTKPQTSNIPLSVTGSATYTGLQNLIKDFERSIRPIDVTTLSMNGSASNMNFSLNMTTYYQPSKTLVVGSKEVK